MMKKIVSGNVIGFILFFCELKELAYVLNAVSPG